VLLRAGGRHDIYVKPVTGKKQPVPRHSEVDEHLAHLSRLAARRSGQIRRGEPSAGEAGLEETASFALFVGLFLLAATGVPAPGQAEDLFT
jgi:hypothetical protein